MANINLKNISKSYDGKTMTIKDVSFDIHDQEFMVLVGPSGCGKSTILRMIAGLEEISGGDIFIGDTRINDLKPKDRDIAMVFQNYALYPHMTVYQNMAFGLKLKKFPRREIDERVQKAAAILEIEDLLQRRPSAMSGGQRQRVAIGRAIVRDPKVFLFDEPLSNLDAKLRVQMRVELQRLHQKLKSTMVYVTHDQTEAMTLGNRIVVLNKGEIMQIGTPMELYNSPINKFVAGFIGSPQINLLEGRLTSGDGIKFVHEQSGLEVDLSDEAVKGLLAKDNPQVILGIRPENIKSRPGKEKSRFCKITLPVTAVEKMGNEILVYVQAGECQLIARFDADASVEVNTKADLYFDTARIIFFDAHTEQVIN